MQIQPYETNHLDAVIQLSLRAWASVFDSIQSAMNPDVYQAFYPDGWRVSQQKAVEGVCAVDDTHVWVATEDNSTIGFVAVKLLLLWSLHAVAFLRIRRHTRTD
jgi:hypothetical protein